MAAAAVAPSERQRLGGPGRQTAGGRRRRRSLRGRRRLSGRHIDPSDGAAEPRRSSHSRARASASRGRSHGREEYAREAAADPPAGTVRRAAAAAGPALMCAGWALGLVCALLVRWRKLLGAMVSRRCSCSHAALSGADLPK